MIERLNDRLDLGSLLWEFMRGCMESRPWCKKQEVKMAVRGGGYLILI